MDKPEEAKMPLTAHLDELRKRLIRVLIVVGFGVVVCWFFREWLFLIITAPLVKVLRQTGVNHMAVLGKHLKQWSGNDLE